MPSLLSPRRRRRPSDDDADRLEPPPESEHHHTDRRGCACEDLALYACSCGFVFKATPTTTIGCPHCGTQQAW